MIASRRKRGPLLDEYCVQLGSLAERRHTELALHTAKRHAETAALVANEAMLQAQAGDRAKTKFLANMTHELRTPLNAIIGFSEIIHTAHDLPTTDCPAFAHHIRDAGAHLLGVVNAVLDLARIDAGKLDLEDEVVPLDELVSAALRAVRPAAEAKSVAIVRGLEIAAAVRADAGKIEQALINVLSNAIKFTDSAGRIEVGSERTPTGGLTISIADNGHGIPSDHLDRVLEPFGQVQDHLTRQSEGAGLGLPLARGLVRAHGGDLALRSAVGVGTTVEIRLPPGRVVEIRSGF